jgi:hypothetical protein
MAGDNSNSGAARVFIQSGGICTQESKLAATTALDGNGTGGAAKLGGTHA